MHRRILSAENSLKMRIFDLSFFLKGNHICDNYTFIFKIYFISMTTANLFFS